MRLRVEWWGRLPYADAHARMLTLLQARVAGAVGDTLILCEHDPVFTLGRRATASANVLDPGTIPVVQVERGGDVTWHGPGQLVGYPIVALPHHDVGAWLRGLEELLITTLARFQVTAKRDPRNTGVWVEGRKIAAIGVALRRWVSWHGFAINLDADLSDFGRIHPCGMDSALVTRLADHVPSCPTPAQAKDTVAAEFRAWWRDWAGPG